MPNQQIAFVREENVFGAIMQLNDGRWARIMDVKIISSAPDKSAPAGVDFFVVLNLVFRGKKLVKGRRKTSYQRAVLYGKYI
jgi:hypothetical protein